MMGPGLLDKALPLLGFSIGYALTSVWATVLLFSSFFTIAGATGVVTASMLPGVVACLGVLLLGNKFPPFDGRTAAASVWATGMAVGTLLCTFPVLASIPPVRIAGLVISGFFAILLILTWFEVFARLSARSIVLLAGFSVLFSAVGCYVVLSLSIEAAGIAMAALPIVSFTLLPKPERTAQPDAPFAIGEAASTISRSWPMLSPSIILREAVSWKTLLGIVISFFVIGAIGTLAPELGMVTNLSPVYLAIPAVLTAVFVLIAVAAPARIDGSVLFKLLLVGVAALAFVLVYYGATDLTFVFFIYITADVLLWTVLALVSKKTPVAPHAVFATGWLAECVGNVAGHNVCALMGNTPYLLALVILLVLVGVGFAFGDGLFVLELEDEDFFVGRPNSNGLAESSCKDRGVIGSAGDVDERDDTAGRDGVARTRTVAQESEVQADSAGLLLPKEASEERMSLDGSGEVVAAEALSAAKPADTPVSVATLSSDPIATFVLEHGLSEREADVFSLWVTGHGLRYIQDTLFISESTVKTHLRSIYRKCGTHNRAEIIALFEQR